VKLWFGPFIDRELEEAPDSVLREIESKLQIEPTEDAASDAARDQMRLRNIQAKQESRRILTERRRNGVRVPDPPKPVKCSSCSALIYFLTTTKRKAMPVDAETVTPGETEFDHTRHRSHFVTCPRANWHRSTPP
jgi:hypothetical protein